MEPRKADPARHAFDRLDTVWQDTIVERSNTYEDAVVRSVIAKLGRQGDLKPLFEALQEATGQRKPKLSCAWFHQYFEFPVTLGIAKLWHLSDLDLSDLFKRFTKTKIFRAYAELQRNLQPDGSMAMVFNWPRISKFVVLHDSHVDFSVRAPMFVRPLKVGNLTSIYTIETLESFVEAHC
jgi:hypothetical protein